MNQLVATVGLDGHFRVRPAVLIGCGRARVAFVLASVLLTILWESMGHWIY
jgi:ABC-type uncharacterized transport system YnjBCD ATPase subunit